MQVKDATAPVRSYSVTDVTSTMEARWHEVSEPFAREFDKCTGVATGHDIDFQVKIGSRREPWAVVLAGGDGVRLRPLSRLISGDDRPKQFCPIFGGQSLLAHTRTRLSGMFNEDKTLFVVTKTHESFYADELRDAHPACVIAQPANRGTGAAVACAVLRIARRDPDAVVAFFPSDHFYSNENRFRAAVASAVQTAAELQDSLILLGAESTHPETEYGWIEPGSIPSWDSAGQFHHVTRFWEKPSSDIAQDLHRQGCLWNTFVMAGRAGVFLELLQSTVPALLQAFSTAERSGEAEDAYLRDDLAAVDFSRQVLSKGAAKLLVFRIDASAGWSDLGAPERVLATLERAGRRISLRAWSATGKMSEGSVAAVA